MVHGLGHRLQEYLPRTIHSEGLLIRWLTLNYESVSEMSVRELADAAGVSPSTIVGSVIRLAAGVIQCLIAQERPFSYGTIGANTSVYLVLLKSIGIRRT